MKKRTQEPQKTSNDVLLPVITSQLRGVIGELEVRRDVVLVGDYERDRAACEAAIQKALDELNEAGGNATEASDDFDIAWAWHGLDEAYVRLARVTSRAHLARRRAEVLYARKQKAAHHV